MSKPSSGKKRTFSGNVSKVPRPHREFVGSVVGLLVFLGGVALLLLTFKLAYGLYSVPPEKALDLNRNKTVDLGTSGTALVGILVRTLLLVVMGLVSTLIANRGIALYTHSLIHPGPGDRDAV